MEHRTQGQLENSLKIHSCPKMEHYLRNTSCQKAGMHRTISIWQFSSQINISNLTAWTPSLCYKAIAQHDYFPRLTVQRVLGTPASNTWFWTHTHTHTPPYPPWIQMKELSPPMSHGRKATMTSVFHLWGQSHPVNTQDIYRRGKGIPECLKNAHRARIP